MDYLATLHQEQSQAGVQVGMPAQPSTGQLDPRVRRLIDDVNTNARQAHANFLLKLGNIR
jgi:hypothetical protein